MHVLNPLKLLAIQCHGGNFVLEGNFVRHSTEYYVKGTIIPHSNVVTVTDLRSERIRFSD